MLFILCFYLEQRVSKRICTHIKISIWTEIKISKWYERRRIGNRIRKYYFKEKGRIQSNTTYSEEMFLFSTSKSIYVFMYFRVNKTAFRCLKHEVCSLRNSFIDLLLKISHNKNCEDALLGGTQKSPKNKKLKKRK